ncbi:MAG TPA: LysR family transcriptional regulator [Vineibacter sp.]|nr:LysR family transcriptional regulator [Vineibacter sp.]
MDLHKLDLNLLRVLDALLETPNTKAASAQLNVSQPTVSFSLKKLREVLDDPLFTRASHGLQPTPQALRLREPLKRIFAIVRDDVLTAPRFDRATTTRPFVFGLSDVSEAVFLPALTQHLLRQAPHAVLKSIPVGLAALEAQLAAGNIDLALGNFQNLKNPSLFQQRLFYRNFVCIMSPGNRLARGRLTLRQFVAANHAVVDRGALSQSILEQAIEQLGIDRTVKVRCSNFLSVPSIIAGTDLLMVVPEDIGTLLARDGRITTRPVPFALPNLHVKQLWHRRFHNDAANKWLRAQVAGLFLNKASGV